MDFILATILVVGFTYLGAFGGRPFADAVGVVATLVVVLVLFFALGAAYTKRQRQ